MKARGCCRTNSTTDCVYGSNRNRRYLDSHSGGVGARCVGRGLPMNRFTHPLLAIGTSSRATTQFRIVAVEITATATTVMIATRRNVRLDHPNAMVRAGITGSQPSASVER